MSVLTLLLAAVFTVNTFAQDSYLGTWRGLVLAPENRCAPYSAVAYSYSTSVENQIVTEYGGIYSPYTGVWFDLQTETDIEHIVARSEAHDSGMCSADIATKTAFSGDLLNLTLADEDLNRKEKVDKDAGEWLPVSNRCWFAHTVVEVKRKYGLSVDFAEAAALEHVLQRCPSTAMQFSKNSVTTDDSQNGTDEKCGPYRNCTELRRDHPNGVPSGHCAYRSGMDRDRDGTACEP